MTTTSRFCSGNQSLASAFLLIHGSVKLVVVAGLLGSRPWSYPLAIFVFSGFTVYQGYALLHRFSLFLGAVTLLDVAVIGLIATEYRNVRGRVRCAAVSP